MMEAIAAIWETKGAPAFCLETIVPKGTLEIIFNLETRFYLHADINGQRQLLPRYFINGYNSIPVRMSLPQQQHFFGVTVHPVAALSLLGAPAREFTDHVLDASLVAPEVECLWERLAECTDFSARVSVVRNWAVSKKFKITPRDRMMHGLLESNHVHESNIASLAAMMNYSTRHLARKIHDLTAWNTEELLHYKKFYRALHLIHTTDHSLTEIAYQSHFSDQSHFIKSFRKFAEMTPGEYRNAKSHLEGHLFSGVR